MKRKKKSFLQFIENKLNLDKFKFNSTCFQVPSLKAGDMLFSGDYVESDNGCFRLTVERNGNLVLLQVQTGKVIWEANQAGNLLIV